MSLYAYYSGNNFIRQLRINPCSKIGVNPRLSKNVRHWRNNMFNNKVTVCGVDTSKLPLLKEAQKEALLKRVKNGDKTARDELINGNLRLVLSVIQRFTGRGENLDDLFQVGCIGLIKSIDNFDISQNVRFSTYAVPTITEC